MHYRSDFDNAQRNWEYRVACQWIGFVSQFAFLHAFFWMNVMCYDIYKRFTRTRAPITSYPVKVFWINSIKDRNH